MSSPLIRLASRGVIILSLIGMVSLAGYVRGNTPGITFGHFTMGGIDLQIDSKSFYNGVSVPSATWTLKNLTPGADKFFNFPDVKPGDSGCNTVSLHVKKGEAWLCLDFKNFQNKDNDVTEPELPDTAATGELAGGMQFFGWVDNGDGKYKSGEKILFGTSTKAAITVLNNKSYSIGDSKNGNTCKTNETKYVGMCWCAGVLTMNGADGTISCDGKDLGNIAQTDSMTVDIGIRATAVGDNAKFVCDPGTQPPPPPVKPKIKSFSAYPNNIKYGQSSTLSWVAEGATSLSIDEGVGAVTGNSKNVSPSGTKTYRLTATNAGGSATASVTVTVTSLSHHH